MDYKEQIKHPKWQKKRLEILERDKYACKNCSSNDVTLHVHHKWYDNKLLYWEYPDNCYLTLCEKCHKYIHTVKSSDEYKDLINLINQFGKDKIEYLSFIIEQLEEYDNNFIEKLASALNSHRFIHVLSFNVDNELIHENVDVRLFLLKEDIKKLKK